MAVVDLGWREGRRDRRYFYGASPEDAIKKKQNFLRKRDDGFAAPRGRAPLVGDWANHWLHHVVDVAETTWQRNYAPIVERYVIPYWGRTRLTNEDLTEELIEEWHGWLLGRGLSTSTVNQAHRIFSSILKAAVRRGRLMRNPCSNVSPPAIERPEIHPPTTEEVEEILDVAMRRRNGVRWLIALAVGTRQGETLGLLWPYVDVADPHRASISIEWELARLPWQHGCDDPHACGYQQGSGRAANQQGLHRFPCPPDCQLRGSHREHIRPCRGTPCTVHVHPGCSRGCRRPTHVCPCPPGCTGHAVSCPRRHGGGLFLKRPKSERSRRTIRIPPVIAAALRRHRAAQAEERLALGPAWEGWAHTPHRPDCPPECTRHCSRTTRRRERVCPECRRPTAADALVFCQPNGLPLDSRADWGEWKGILAELGLDDYRVHDARHRAATALLEAGEDVRVVQQILGHASADFTRRVYQHVTDRLQDRAAASMQRGLGAWADSQSDSQAADSDRYRNFFRGL